jgi:threonine dehydratase
MYDAHGGSRSGRGSESQPIALQGVVTHSSGNHGGALALAAKLRGIPAHVVVPHDTPLCKVGAIEGYGGAPHS